jgi:hypothetical protein
VTMDHRKEPDEVEQVLVLMRDRQPLWTHA